MSKIALIDCDNFYASCERLFRPELNDKPIAILSNNDGCVVARSSETKELGIAMGAPYFKFRQEMKDKGVHVFSSNYCVYGDLSSRIMNTLDSLSPNLEVYSIDEAFADMSGFETHNLYEHCLSVRNKIYKNIGIPVSIGVGSSKTLAKIATRVVKKSKKTKGVFIFESEKQIHSVLKKVEIGDIWGIGRKYAERLKHDGMYTAYDLSIANSSWIKRKYSVVVQRTVHELNGESCIALEDMPDKQQIMVSRSFKDRILMFDKLHYVIAGYVSRGCEKLRKQGSVARGITVFIRTSPFSDKPQYSHSKAITLDQYSADTTTFARVAIFILKKLYREGYEYAKAGIMMFDIIPDKQQQFSLFQTEKYDTKARQRMKLLDDINGKFGRQTLRLASENQDRWNMNRNHLSPRYTTCWDDIMIVK